ncbi:hypothetical protein ACTPT9_003504 [Serratia marcescens]|uniref:hypothetical protein n=1 Tax=Serratia marcescens TaxID=615 RepID=UPI002794CD45|nr:hypothetical protein [Serratia marcescens]ELD1858867.1 hypothetical protein [Serratia marcescens]ELM0004726.1 hypothetical protein [Serratia marcescens]MDP8028104.1 hypothetical protein [Serratia marcescens]HBH7558800.1 hypothetical protein [Serratia marcescens]HEJ0022279.1 hypothetical protein [Serratia marcescens]
MSKLKGFLAVNFDTKIKFYNFSHGKKLLNRENYPLNVIDKIKNIVRSGCNINGGDFVLYSLFHNKSFGITQSEFSSKIHSMENILSMHISALNSTLQKRYSQALPRGVTDNIGESIGMLVISHCYNIADADWDVIPETNKKKTMDFKLAISNSGLVNLETKGTSAVILSLTKPYKDICKKKIANPVTPGNFNYGTITTIDTKEICCYLIDPPGNDEEVDLIYLRIVSRLQYYLRVLNIIAPESELINIIDERIKQLIDKEIDCRDNVKLKPVKRASFNYSSGNMPTYFFNAYYDGSLNGGFGGRCFFVDSNNLLFLGVSNNLLIEIVNQSSDQIARDLVSDGEYFEVSMDIPDNALHRKDENGKNIVSEERFYNTNEILRAEGQLYFKNGIVIGILSY